MYVEWKACYLKDLLFFQSMVFRNKSTMGSNFVTNWLGKFPDD
jgi:hypothetical protein